MKNLLQDINLFKVGGVVRDELLGIKSIDVDYTYQGDAIKYAENSDFITIIRTNPSFHTLHVIVNDKEIDLASTRTETYPRKGHLPLVDKIGVSIEEDLKRRDFTVNALAKNTLNGNLVDVFNGKKDIENGLLRILHKDSFIDDPTRIVRGLKFSVRFGFELEEKTKKLQEEYLENINYDMSYHRLKQELKDAFSLNRHEVFDKFAEQKIYKLLGSDQKLPNITGYEIENALKGLESDYIWLIYLSFFDLSKFELTKIERKILEKAELLNTKAADKNTPVESVIINNLRQKCG